MKKFLTEEEIASFSEKQAAAACVSMLEADFEALQDYVRDHLRWSAPRAAMACMALASAIASAPDLPEQDREHLLVNLEAFLAVARRGPH